jgi:6-phosphogluconate dehydrogenase (decarboxylating)
MQIGMIGLGRMGANMARRLIRKGHTCVVFNRSPQAVNELIKEKAIGATSLAEVVGETGFGSPSTTRTSYPVVNSNRRGSISWSARRCRR